MKNIQALTDKAAISFSMLCMVHCLAMPLLIVLLPSLAALPLQGEAFHLWMLVAVVPTSAYALTMGCKKHQDYRVMLVGGIGLTILVAAALLGHDLLGELWEKAFTVVGATIIAIGHVWNFKRCQTHDDCGCSESE